MIFTLQLESTELKGGINTLIDLGVVLNTLKAVVDEQTKEAVTVDAAPIPFPNTLNSIPLYEILDCVVESIVRAVVDIN